MLLMLIMTMFLEDKRYATQMEEEASECELNQFFKQDLISCSERNECEPRQPDINFSSDIVISHSVIKFQLT